MTLSLKNKTIIAIVLFVVVFGGLLTAATLCDLQVSDVLTATALKDGDYLATDFFGVLFEIIGSSPIYLMIAFCTIVLFYYIRREWSLRPLNEILQAVFAVLTVVAFWFFVKDIFGYTIEHVEFGMEKSFEDAYPWANAAIIASEVIIAIMLAAFALVAARGIKRETIKKLLKFVLAFLLAAIVANLIVAIVKVPAGRMRYRAMNASEGYLMLNNNGEYVEGGFANYTRWYVMTGNNDIFDSKAIFGVSDAFKSFPSGHTCAAGMSYGLIMLIDVLDIKSKGKKALIWAVALLWTGLTALSRIVVGAHFFSDVLMGGTIAFLSMALFNELIVCKCKHIKALLGKKAELPVLEAVDTITD